MLEAMNDGALVADYFESRLTKPSLKADTCPT